ncbi:MAG: hypothetical protein E7665_03810 [Ruminococcaceae bacterium]|nr:hypothetical protein [Oscillospiraceae bacterium]
MINENKYADVRNFGASPMGDTDCSEAVLKAVTSLKEGGTLYFPSGTYLIEKPINISGDHLTVTGDGKQSKIVYTYEQKEDDDHRSASLFIFEDNISDVIVKDMSFEYTGYFFDEPQKSYYGRVSALNFNTCFDITVSNVEIKGFNACGIAFYGTKDNYSKRIKVEKCYIHHNRVAGVLYGFTDGITITNNTLEHHGSKNDGGTGYGTTGWSGATPLNIQIIGNKCSFNSRKGIDLHAGMNAVIEGNICEGNILYGIYAEGSRTNNMVITGNMITNMVLENTPYLPIYNWIEGIGFGTAGEASNSLTERNFLISENEILNFSFENGGAIPFNCYYSQHCGSIQIKNNIVNAGRISAVVSMGGKGAHTERCKNNISITGNQIKCRECTSHPFIFSSADTFDISHNRFDAGITRLPIIITPGDDNGAVICTYNNFSYSEGRFPERKDGEAQKRTEGDPLYFEYKKDTLSDSARLIEKNIINGKIK